MTPTNGFFPITTAFLYNGQYVKGPYLADLNAANIVLILLASVLDANDNTVEAFEIHYNKPYASKNDVYYFLTGGETLAQLLTWFNTNSVNTLERFTGHKATDLFIENKTPYKDIILNTSYVNERELTKEGDTNLYVYTGTAAKDRKIITVEGDQTKTNKGVGYPGPGVIV